LIIYFCAEENVIFINTFLAKVILVFKQKESESFWCF